MSFKFSDNADLQLLIKQGDVEYDKADGLQIDLHNGDCLEPMKDIPDGSVDLVLTDPPYNIGKAKTV